MIIKTFRVLNKALEHALTIKNNYPDLYISYTKYHYNLIASNKIKNFTAIVYFWHNGFLQKNRSSEFPAIIFAVSNFNDKSLRNYYTL